MVSLEADGAGISGELFKRNLRKFGRSLPRPPALEQNRERQRSPQDPQNRMKRMNLSIFRMHWWRALSVCVLISSACFFWQASWPFGKVRAATITVTNLNDSGAGSLRQAISSAQNGDVINFQAGLSGTINLNSPTLCFDCSAVRNVTVNGPGANVITVKGLTASGTFDIFSITRPGSNITISGLTITRDGQPANFGAAIDNKGTVTVNNCVINGHQQSSLQGAGIANTGTATIQNCSFTNNTAADGGAIFNRGTLTVTGSSFTDNFILRTNGSGGAIATIGGVVAVSQSTFTNNRVNVSGGMGGAIANFSGNLTVNGCTLINNQALTTGGGVAAFSGTTQLINSTLNSNVAANGGGLHSGTGVTDIINCTFTANQANQGGGLNGSASVRNSIIAGNLANFGPDAGNFMTSLGHNLVGIGNDGNGFTNGINADRVGLANAPLDPKLGPLQNNGGPTKTHALLCGSPALNTGDNSVLGAPLNLSTDQRGLPRKFNSNVDIGAFEIQSTEANCNFANGNTITLPAGGAASPYPSTINVSGLSGFVSKVTVKLNTLHHENQNGLEILLVGPQGQGLVLMSDANGDPDNPFIFDRTISFDDAAQFPIADGQALFDGTYRPANYGAGDVFPSPAPATFSSPAPAGTATLASVFNSANPNGAWQLFIFNDQPFGTGSVRGWSLQIQTDHPALDIQPATVPAGAVNVTYPTTQFASPNGHGVVNFFSSGTLPPGLGFLANQGVLSGTPTAGGNFNFTVSAVDADGCMGARSYTLAIPCPPITITNANGNSTTLPIGTANQSYNASLVATGGAAPYTFQILSGFLPTGMTFSSDGVFSGTPTDTTENTLQIKTTDAFGCTGQQAFDLLITCQTIPVNPPAQNSAVVNVPLSVQFTQTNGLGTVNFTTSSTLPTGITLNTNGLLSGTPTQTGVFPLTVVAKDKNQCQGTVNYTLTITNCPTSFTVNSLADTPDAVPGDGLCLNASNQCTLRAAIMEANNVTACAPLAINFSVTGTIDLASALDGFNHPNLIVNGPGANLLTVRRLNDAPNFGIFGVNSGKTVTISGLTLTGGAPNGDGGAIFNSGVLTLRDCVLTNNSGGHGGAVISTGTLTVIGCTFHNNRAFQTGGALEGVGTVNVANSTFSANGANFGGGGIDVASGSAVLTNCTFVGNTAGFEGSQLRKESGTTVFVRNTLVDHVTNAAPILFGTFTSRGNNLIGSSDGSNGFVNGANGDQIGTLAAPLNALLAPLAIYGGATPTHALLPGSPALDAAQSCVLTNTCPTNNLGFNLSTDQRGAGFNRQSGNFVDIGAFESRGFTLAISGGNNQSTGLNALFPNPLSVTVTASGNEPVNNGIVTFAPPASGASCAIAGNPATITNGAAVTGSVTSNAILGGPYNVTANTGGATSPVQFSLSNVNAPNTPPTLTPETNVSLQQGATFFQMPIATVTDLESGPGNVSVTVNGGSSATVNGVTVSQLVNNSGTIIARVAAGCSVTTANFTLTATDLQSASVSATLTVTVTAINGFSIAVSPDTLLNGLTQVPYTATLSATGGSGSFSFSVASGALPSGLAISGNQIVGTPTTAGAFAFTIRATDTNGGCFGERSYTVLIGSSGLMYYPLPRPVRLLDTRTGASPNACNQPNAQIAGNTSFTLVARGTCDGVTIPTNAVSLTGNVTTVQPSTNGFLTLFPSDASRPGVSNSNFLANEVLNNAFTVGIAASDGAFKVFVSTTTHVVIDINGFYAPPTTGGLFFHPLPKPIRLLETRQGLSGCQTPGAALQANTTRLQTGVLTCDGVTIPTGAQALVGNATTTNSQSNGFLTLFPADATRPFTASSNFVAGINRNAPFTVGLSLNGEFDIFTAATTDLVIDVMGYFSAQANDVNGQGLLFTSLGSPLRLLDTRAGQTACFTSSAPMTGGAVFLQDTQVPCSNLTSTARGLVGNVSALNATANGFLTFWPSNAAQPTVATSNYQTGRVFNRHFTVGLGPDAAFNRFASSTTDVIIDISGFFAP